MKKLILRRVCTTIALFAVLSVAAVAQNEEVVTIRFPKGKSSKTINYAVLRDEVIIYKLRAKGGQRLSVKITSIEKNATFSIQQPNGDFITRSGDEFDVMVWNGVLPVTGEYNIIVSPTRGNADYRMTVSVK